MSEIDLTVIRDETDQTVHNLDVVNFVSVSLPVHDFSYTVVFNY